MTYCVTTTESSIRNYRVLKWKF